MKMGTLTGIAVLLIMWGVLRLGELRYRYCRWLRYRLTLTILFGAIPVGVGTIAGNWGISGIVAGVVCLIVVFCYYALYCLGRACDYLPSGPNDYPSC